MRTCVDCSAIKEQQEQAALAKFEKRFGKMHHLLSTSTLAGIYRSPYQTVTNTVPLLAGTPLEDHIRNNIKHVVSSGCSAEACCVACCTGHLQSISSSGTASLHRQFDTTSHKCSRCTRLAYTKIE